MRERVHVNRTMKDLVADLRLMKRNLLLCTLAVCEYRLISQVVNEKGPESFFQC